MATIGFIGLGNMGRHMATNQVRAGHEVRGFDLSEKAREDVAKAGVTPVATLAELVDGADVIITMLPKGDHVRATYLGDQGVIALAGKETILIDSSTIDIASCRAVHDAAAKAGLTMVDAPVSGGPSGAEAGTLTFMVGGAPEAVEKARPFIEPMAGNIFTTGGPTTGEAAKIANNMMLFICLQSCAEGAVLAERLGLDAKVFWDIAAVSSGNSWALQTWYPVPDIIPSAAANNGFAANFRTDLARKDIGLALSAAQEVGLDLPAAKEATRQFDQLIEDGFINYDCSLIIRNYDPNAAGAPKEA